MARASLISDWLMRLALNSGVALEPGTRAVYVKLWTDSFADLDDAKLNAAFQKTLLTWGSEFGKVGNTGASRYDSIQKGAVETLGISCRPYR